MYVVDFQIVVFDGHKNTRLRTTSPAILFDTCDIQKIGHTTGVSCRQSAGRMEGNGDAGQDQVPTTVESKTRTHNGRVGSAQRTADGGAGRSWANQAAEISVGSEAIVPLALQGTVNNCFERLVASKNTRESHINRSRNKRSG